MTTMQAGTGVGVLSDRRRTPRRTTLTVFVLLAVFSVATAVMFAQREPASVASAEAPGLTIAAHQAQISPADTLVVIHEQNLGPRSVINVLDQRTGRVLAVVNAADSPLVLLRSSRNQLLISDVAGDGSPHSPQFPRLLVLDLNRSLALSVPPIPMPDRTTYPMYTPSMALSQDERYLYYMKRRDCGFLCNEVDVGVINLDARTEVVAALPVNCGQLQFTRLGASNVTTMCPILGSLWEVGPAGTPRLLAAGFPPTGLYAGVAGAQAYWVDMNGGLTVKDTSGAVVRTKSLIDPGTGALTGVYRWEAEGQLVLGVKSSATAESIERLLVLDIGGWGTKQLSVPARTSFVAPLRGRSLAVVHDGAITIIDGNSGLQIRGLERPPAGQAPWLVAP